MPLYKKTQYLNSSIYASIYPSIHPYMTCIHFKCKCKIFVVEKICNTLPDLCNGVFKCPHGQEYDSLCNPLCQTAGYSTDFTNSLKCNGDDWDGTENIKPCIGKCTKEHD